MMRIASVVNRRKTDMKEPVIDPSTLNEEQKTLIKRRYELAEVDLNNDFQKMYDKGVKTTLEWLYGKNMFN